MTRYDLSILIPSRNEMFLARTIEDLLQNIRGKTEIIAVLDGQWAKPGINDHKDVTVIYHSQSIGQRAATNEAARLSRAKYVMKVDAHCAFDEGFDYGTYRNFSGQILCPYTSWLHSDARAAMKGKTDG